MLRALFVGGVVDNSEMDLEGPQPPAHYPEHGHANPPRYKLRMVGRNEGDVVYAVYGASELPDAEIERIAQARGYARRFEIEAVNADH